MAVHLFVTESLCLLVLDRVFSIIRGDSQGLLPRAIDNRTAIREFFLWIITASHVAPSP